MRIRQIRIERYRGIRSLEWCPQGRTTCLLGAGDSTKTTILDAIELALSPRWNVPINDADFFAAKTQEPIVITVTIGELPGTLVTEEKYGLDLRGWGKDGKLKDEPEGDDEAVLTIRFSVDEKMEPAWLVVNDRKPEGRSISARDREALGVVRLGTEIDRHLAWGRGSALSRNTETLDGVGLVLAAAHREARDMVKKANLAQLGAVADRAKEAAIQMGVRVLGQYRPGLDAGFGVGGVGPISFHEDDIPVRLAGLGTRRLVALALQALAVKTGAILLIDEVEHGLEPHRLRHLLRVLNQVSGQSHGQVFMTTHSSVPLEELPAESLNIVRSEAGATTVTRVGLELQDLVRRGPEALLGRKVLVCEGKTELGICRALQSYWAASHDDLPITHTGSVLVCGSGQTAPKTAEQLARLGYAVALLADSDKPMEPSEPVLAKCGVNVITWAGKTATEERVGADLPLASLEEVVKLAIEIRGEQSVLDAIGNRIPTQTPLKGTDIKCWLQDGLTEDQVRHAIGQAAKKCEWFKRIDLGEELGMIIKKALPAMVGTDLEAKLTQVANWIYGK
jgi:hypothetical protein